MDQTGPGHVAGGEDLVGVVFGVLDAVGGEEHRAGEGGQLLLLVLPGRAVMPGQMREGMQQRIGVGGQHLAVGVDVDARVASLLQQGQQVGQVVAGDEDGLALAPAQGDGRGHGRAERTGIARFQQLHGAQVGLAAFQHQPQPAVEVVALGIQFGAGTQAAIQEGGHVGITLAQLGGMVGIGGHALEAVEQDLHGGAHVLVVGQAVDGGFPQIQGSQRRGGRGTGHTGGQGRGALQAFFLHGAQGDGIEIHIGQGGEQGLESEVVGGGVHDAGVTGHQGHGRQFAQLPDQLVLLDGHGLVLAADAKAGTGLALGGLFTLVAKHGGLLVLRGMGVCP